MNSSNLEEQENMKPQFKPERLLSILFLQLINQPITSFNSRKQSSIIVLLNFLKFNKTINSMCVKKIAQQKGKFENDEPLVLEVGKLFD